ncbi:MAG: site-specific integrase [Bifidobacterium mongoliense]|nr:site-specific integrase [Bifidobacterium mongoliense]
MPRRGVPPEQWRGPIAAWLNSLNAAALSSLTMETRRRQLTTVARSLKIAPDRVSAETLLSWFGAQRWKPETRKGYRNALRGFFTWMCATGFRADNPSLALPVIHRPNAHPHPCPDKKIHMALGRANAQERIMIRLAAECGLRRAEIAQVSSDDVVDDLIGRSLIVHGKGDKQRTVPLPDDLAATIECANGYVYPGRWGGHVEASYVGKRLSRLLGEGWSGHSLRHRYATSTYVVTHDLLLVSHLLGHASVETTERYVALPDSRLRIALDSIVLAS